MCSYLCSHFAIFEAVKRCATPRKYPRRESNPHLRFRKPPFYPLNYGDRKKGKSKKDEGKIQMSDCRLGNPDLRHRKLPRAREPRLDPRARLPRLHFAGDKSRTIPDRIRAISWLRLVTSSLRNIK